MTGVIGHGHVFLGGSVNGLVDCDGLGRRSWHICRSGHRIRHVV